MIDFEPPFWWRVICDGCSLTEKISRSENAPALCLVEAYMHTLGWTVEARDDERKCWVLLCPACSAPVVE